MDPIFAADSPTVQKLQIRLIRQSRRFETLARAPPCEMFSRDPRQLRINDVDHPLQRSALPSFHAAGGGGPLPSCRSKSYQKNGAHQPFRCPLAEYKVGTISTE